MYTTHADYYYLYKTYIQCIKCIVIYYLPTISDISYHEIIPRIFYTLCTVILVLYLMYYTYHTLDTRPP